MCKETLYSGHRKPSCGLGFSFDDEATVNYQQGLALAGCGKTQSCALSL